MHQRGTFAGRRAPGPFHCLGCKSYVHGTASGHCPRCGFVPPTAPHADEPAAPLRGSIVLVILTLLVVIAALVR